MRKLLYPSSQNMGLISNSAILRGYSRLSGLPNRARTTFSGVSFMCKVKGLSVVYRRDFCCGDFLAGRFGLLGLSFIICFPVDLSA